MGTDRIARLHRQVSVHLLAVVVISGFLLEVRTASLTQYPHRGTCPQPGSLLDENPGSTLSGIQQQEIERVRAELSCCISIRMRANSNCRRVSKCAAASEDIGAQELVTLPRDPGSSASSAFMFWSAMFVRLPAPETLHETGMAACGRKMEIGDLRQAPAQNRACLQQD